MKHSKILYFITVLCYGIFFHTQSPGFNYLLFSIILIGSSYSTHKINVRSWGWIVSSGSLLFSSFFTMYYGNYFSVTMSLLSATSLLIFQKYSKASVISGITMGIVSVLGALPFMIANFTEVKKLKEYGFKQTNRRKQYAPYIIAFIALIVFISLYRAINPVFDIFFTDLFKNINWAWLGFTIVGAVFLYVFFFVPRYFKKLFRFEKNLTKSINYKAIQTHNDTALGKVFSYKNEKLSAYILFTILNILLLLLNITDVQYVIIKADLPNDITYSEYVHNGVGAVIFSIICVIAVISFYFRGYINNDKESKKYKFLAYIWLTQNLFLVAMSVLKNYMYIDAYMLTFKRIGVYYYLAFTAIGLFISFLKIYKDKKHWYIVKHATTTMLIGLTLSTTVNWNIVVTNYNLKNDTAPDYVYLKTLGFANYITLYENHAFNKNEYAYFNLHFSNTKESYYLPKPIGNFLAQYEKKGKQSYCSTKNETYNYFQHQAKLGKINTYKSNIIKNKVQ